MNKPKLPRIDIREDEISQTRDTVEKYGDIVDRVVSELSKEVTEELDVCILEIRDMLKSPQDVGIDALNFYIGYLPTLIYFAGDRAESLGIKSDSSSAIRKEKYDDLYTLATGKTIPDKQSETSKLVMNETVVESAYKRAYKKSQIKIESADRVLNSLKKMLQWRISELETTGMNSTGRILHARNKS